MAALPAETAVERLLAKCKEELRGDEDALAVIARAKQVLVDKELVSPAIIASSTVEQLKEAGVSLGAALALKAAFPSAADPAGGAAGVVGAWRQVDGSMLVDKRKLLYATMIVENDAVNPVKGCEIRALVDSGCTLELVIPKRKAEQLGLVERDRTTVTGFGDKISNMIVYRTALVKLPATVSGDEVMYKQADLVVAARDVPLLQQEEDYSEFAGFRAPQVVLEDGAIQISPLSSPRSPTAVPEAILGLPGMKKLHLKLDAERCCLLPVVGGELVVAALPSDGT